METLIKAIILIVVIIGIVILALGFSLLISYCAYWLTLWAGAPKYVAVIVGIAVFILAGITAKITRK